MRNRVIIAVALVAVVAGCGGKNVEDSSSGPNGSTVPAGTAPSDRCKNVKLTAPEVGVTEKAITVTVIADTGSPIKPGLFQGSVDAVKAWAAYVNDNGGLACRNVVVKAVDSRLSADETRNAIAAACDDSVALVGTTALFVNDVSALETCKDQAGDTTGLPDLAVLQTESPQQCSPMSYAVLPISGSCPYSGTGPRTYTYGRAQNDYYLEKYGPDLHGVQIIPKDLPSTIAAATPFVVAAEEMGIKIDKMYGASGLDTQPAYTPIVLAMKSNKSNFARNSLDYSGTVMMRKEAQIQGVTTVKVWDCSLQCYDKRLIESGGAAVEGQHAWLNMLPLEDKDANAQLQALFEYEGRQGNEPDGFGIEAWLAGSLFAQVVNTVVDDKGPNAITRENLLAAVRNVHDFTGGGIAPPTDIGNKKASPCVVGLQVQKGKFVRVDPTTPGEFDCGDNKTITTTMDPVKAYKG